MAGTIYEAIPAILADIDAIGKNRKNQQQGFNFRGIDDVMNTLHPLLAKHKVFPTCEFTDIIRTERTTAKGGTLFSVALKGKYTLHAVDGSYVSTEAIGEAMDSGDKATNKAMSACYKYAMFQLLCIPTEAVDPDEETHSDITPKKQTEPLRVAGKAPDPEPLDPVRRAADDLVISTLLVKVKQHAGYPEALNNLLTEAKAAYEAGNGHVRQRIREEVKPAIVAELKKLEPQTA